MMVKTLVENIALNHNIKANHGLSFYIETDKHKILFDVGANENLLHNARQMGVQLDKIDTVVISHAHLDHGGALDIFLKENDLASIYLQKNAFKKYYAIVGDKKFDLSLNNALREHPQIKLVDDFLRIDEELSIFGDITGSKLASRFNGLLYKDTGTEIVQDDFSHEQCLVVELPGKSVLFGGCAHNGIVNILEKGENIYQTEFDFVFSGFHMSDPVSKLSEDPEFITQIEQELLSRKTVFYTGHCTGQEVYETLKKNMNDKIWYAFAGLEVIL